MFDVEMKNLCTEKYICHSFPLVFSFGNKIIPLVGLTNFDHSILNMFVPTFGKAFAFLIAFGFLSISSAQRLSEKLDKMTQISKTSKSVAKMSEKGSRTLFYEFDVRYIDGAPDGVSARKVLTVNGQLPGPMIVGNKGDTVKIKVTNQIENPTTIHWHGMFQRGTPFEDGAEGVTQCGITPGNTQTYTFKLEQTGTFWWHSHEVYQYTEGCFGPLIILNPDQDEDDPFESHSSHHFDPADQIVLMLSEWNHKSGAELAKWYLSATSEGNEPLPDSILINGRGRFDCDQLSGPEADLTCDPDLQTAWRFWATRGKTYRIRVINSGGFTSYNFGIDGHTLKVIELDGNLVRSKSDSDCHVSDGEICGQECDMFSIAPGQRVSFLVRMDHWLNEDGTQPQFAIRSIALTQFFPGEGPDIRSNPDAFIPEIHAILQYESSDLMQRKLREKFGFQFQYFQNIQEDSTCSTDLALSEIPASPVTPLIDQEDLRFLDESRLAAIDGPAPSPPPSEIRHVVLNIENMDQPEYTDKGFYLTFNNVSYKYDYLDRDSYGEINGPLLARVVNHRSIPPTAHPIYLPQLDQVVQVTVNNHDGGPHPLHLHGHRFWVMGKGREGNGDFVEDDEDFPLAFDVVTRDTAFVEASSWLVLRFVTDNPGVWLFHCHIQWHAMGGLSVAFIEAEEELRERIEEVPQEVKTICGYHGNELY